MHQDRSINITSANIIGEQLNVEAARHIEANTDSKFSFSAEFSLFAETLNKTNGLVTQIKSF